MPSFVHTRAVHFDEVDAAGIVFFAKFLGYGHEAMEALFGTLPGKYHGLVVGRRIGFPAVHVEADYRAPLRFGDIVTITLDVTKIGTTSCTLRYRLTRGDGTPTATVLHTTVCCDIAGEPKKIPFPADVRALLEAYRADD